MGVCACVLGCVTADVHPRRAWPHANERGGGGYGVLRHTVSAASSLHRHPLCERLLWGADSNHEATELQRAKDSTFAPALPAESIRIHLAAQPLRCVPCALLPGKTPFSFFCVALNHHHHPTATPLAQCGRLPWTRSWRVRAQEVRMCTGVNMCQGTCQPAPGRACAAVVRRSAWPAVDPPALSTAHAAAPPPFSAEALADFEEDAPPTPALAQSIPAAPAPSAAAGSERGDDSADDAR